MTIDPVVAELEDWLSRNSAPYMCWRLGYRSTNVLLKWIREQNIPEPVMGEVIEIMKNPSPPFDAKLVG